MLPSSILMHGYGNTEQTRAKLNLGNCHIGKSMHTPIHTHTSSQRYKNGILFGVWDGIVLDKELHFLNRNQSCKETISDLGKHPLFLFVSPPPSPYAPLSLPFYPWNILEGEKKHTESHATKSKIFTENSVTYWLTLNLFKTV